METIESVGIESYINKWKDAQIASASYGFDYDGNSVYRTNFIFTKLDGSTVPNSEIIALTDYLENLILGSWVFYNDYDNIYYGEYGDIKISLGSDDQKFVFGKESVKRFGEDLTDDMELLITEEEKDFLTEYVSEIYETEASFCYNLVDNIRFKKDLIITKEVKDLMNNLMKKLINGADNHEFSLQYYSSYGTMINVEENQTRAYSVHNDEIDSIAQIGDHEYSLTVILRTSFNVECV